MFVYHSILSAYYYLGFIQYVITSALHFVMLNHLFIELIYNVVMSTHYLVGFGSRVVLSFYRYVSFIYYLIWSIYHLLLSIWHIILFGFYVIWLTLRSIVSKGHKTLLLALYILLLCQVIILIS